MKKRRTSPWTLLLAATLIWCLAGGFAEVAFHGLCSYGHITFLCQNVSAQDREEGVRQEFLEEGMELPLLEDQIKKPQPKKKIVHKKKTKYPHDRVESELMYRFRHNDNVYKSSSIPVPGDPKVLHHQQDEMNELWFDYQWDHYVRLGTKLSLDYYYRGRDYQEFDTNNRQRNTLRLQWQERLSPGEYLRLGVRESRRLAVAHDRFGNVLNTDFDYFRTDLYLEYDKDLTEVDEISLEYRFVQYDYDETTGKISDDWNENRIEMAWTRDLSPSTQLTLYNDTRFRNYREEYARRGVDGERIPGTLREQTKQEWGLNIEQTFSSRLQMEMQVEYEILKDPYQNYYSFQGWDLLCEADYRFSDRMNLYIEGRMFKRDYEKRRFLASRLPNPNPPPSHLDPFIDLYEDYRLKMELTYLCSEKFEIGGGWRHRWYHVNDPTEAFRANEVYAWLRYYFKSSAK